MAVKVHDELSRVGRVLLQCPAVDDEGRAGGRADARSVVHGHVVGAIDAAMDDMRRMLKLMIPMLGSGAAGSCTT